MSGQAFDFGPGGPIPIATVEQLGNVMAPPPANALDDADREELARLGAPVPTVTVRPTAPVARPTVAAKAPAAMTPRELLRAARQHLSATKKRIRALRSELRGLESNAQALSRLLGAAKDTGGKPRSKQGLTIHGNDQRHN